MVNVADLDTEKLEEEINEIVIQEVVKWMMIKMPQKTGRLLASYINCLLMLGDITTYLYYGDYVELMVSVAWTNPSTQPQARAAAWEYAESLVMPATQYVLQRHGLNQ
jgi:hypothetical protein